MRRPSRGPFSYGGGAGGGGGSTRSWSGSPCRWPRRSSTSRASRRAWWPWTGSPSSQPRGSCGPSASWSPTSPRRAPTLWERLGQANRFGQADVRLEAVQHLVAGPQEAARREAWAVLEDHAFPLQENRVRTLDPVPLRALHDHRDDRLTHLLDEVVTGPGPELREERTVARLVRGRQARPRVPRHRHHRSVPPTAQARGTGGPEGPGQADGDRLLGAPLGERGRPAGHQVGDLAARH